MENTKKTWKEKLTSDLKKWIALFTQVGVVGGMITGGIYWVNQQFNLLDLFAEKVAQKASEKVLTDMEAVSFEDFQASQDSIYKLANGILDIIEYGLNEQDSLILVVNRVERKVGNLSNQVLENSFVLDTLNASNLEEIKRMYEKDSTRVAFDLLHEKWRFREDIAEIKKTNHEILQGVRGLENRSFIKPKKRGFLRGKFDAYPNYNNKD